MILAFVRQRINDIIVIRVRWLSVGEMVEKKSKKWHRICVVRVGFKCFPLTVHTFCHSL